MATIVSHFTLLVELCQEDNRELDELQAYQVAMRLMGRPALPGACVHQMPEGLSSIKFGVCLRCGSEVKN